MPLKSVTILPVNYCAKANVLMNGPFGQLKTPQRQFYLSIAVTITLHYSELVSGYTFSTKLHPNITAQTQPMDQKQVVEKFIKFILSLSHFVHQLISSDCSVKDFLTRFNINDGILAATIAWSDVKSQRALHRTEHGASYGQMLP